LDSKQLEKCQSLKQVSIIAAADLARFLETARARELRVVGLEGFRIVGSSIVPDMYAIADFSSIAGMASSADTVDEALHFVAEVERSDLLYEVTFVENPE
jgi:hypothetical protein